jgi:hypothetical protein
MREGGEHLVGANDHEDPDQGRFGDHHTQCAPFNTACPGCTKTRLQAGMDRSTQGRAPARWSMPERQWR